MKKYKDREFKQLSKEAEGLESSDAGPRPVCY